MAKIKIYDGTNWVELLKSSDISSWAKESSKPTYTASEVGAVPTSRTVNGKTLSANITLSASDVGAATSSHTHTFSAITSRGEAFLAWGGQNLSGSYGPIDAAMVPELGSNRLAFMPATAISVEYSRDGGSTWTDYGADNNAKINLFNGNGTSLIIGKATSGAGNIATNQYQLRINIYTGAAAVYTVLNKFVIYLSTSGTNNNWCTIRARKQSDYTAGNDTWTVFANKVSVSGWSGYNVINTSGLTTYGNTAASQYGHIQLIFGCDTGSTNNSYAGLTINKIFGFGGVGWTTPSTMAKYGRMYTYDANKNVTFPAGVSATSFTENGTTLANKYAPKSHTHTISQITDFPTISNATITIKQSGRTDQTFTLNGSATTINLDNTTYSNATTNAAGLMSSTDKTRLDNIYTALNGTDSSKIDTIAEVYAFLEDYAQTTDLATLLATKVPTSRTVNGKALSNDISLTASDVGARSSSWMPTASQVGALPTGTTLDNIADGSTRKLANYMPLSGGTFSGTIKFNSSSLPSKSLQYIVGIDAFASGGEMGWQSKSDFLSGYATQTWVGQQGYLIANDISGKANDNSVVHKAGAESITGLKTFSNEIDIQEEGGDQTLIKISAEQNAFRIGIVGDQGTTSKYFTLSTALDSGTIATQGWVTSQGYLTAHPTISVSTDTTDSGSLSHSGTFTAVTSVTRDSNGHVTKINTKTYTLPASGDTNYYPIRSYSSGLQISSYSGSANCALYVPYATASAYGVVKPAAVRSSAITSTTGGTTSDRYYGVEIDSNGKLFVNVPWTGGSSIGNYVTTDTTQSISGQKTFTGGISVQQSNDSYLTLGDDYSRGHLVIWDGADGAKITLEAKTTFSNQTLYIPNEATGRTLATQEWVTGKGYTSNTGTVTSVAAGTGLSISGTASVNPTVNIASGYKLPTTSEWNLAYSKPIIMLEDNSTTTAGTWLAKTSLISALADGQIFLYKITKAGASTTTLNVSCNGTASGAKTVYRVGTTKLTTQYAVGSYIMLYYNGTYFYCVNDYDANSYAYVRQYQSGQNAAGSGTLYPILTRYNLTNKNASYDTAYTRFYTDTYIDTSNGYLYAPKVYSGGNEVLTGITSAMVTTALGFTPTANTGTVTQVKVGSTAYNPSSGVVSLPAYPTTLPANGGDADTVDGYDADDFYLASNPNGYTSVTESTVTNWGFTKNAGTVTSVKVGNTSYSPSSGVVSLPAYPTVTQKYEHNITVYLSGTVHVRFTLITTSATALTYSTLSAALNGAGYTSAATAKMASGMVNYSSSTTAIATGVYSTNTTTNLTITCVSLITTSSTTATMLTSPQSNNTSSKTLSSSYTVQDYVRTL